MRALGDLAVRVQPDGVPLALRRRTLAVRFGLGLAMDRIRPTPRHTRKGAQWPVARCWLAEGIGDLFRAVSSGVALGSAAFDGVAAMIGSEEETRLHDERGDFHASNSAKPAALPVRRISERRVAPRAAHRSKTYQ